MDGDLLRKMGYLGYKEGSAKVFTKNKLPDMVIQQQQRPISGSDAGEDGEGN
jgi:hypothetical protein